MQNTINVSFYDNTVDGITSLNINNNTSATQQVPLSIQIQQKKRKKMDSSATTSITKRARELFTIREEQGFVERANSMSEKDFVDYAATAKSNGEFNQIEDLILMLYFNTKNYTTASTILHSTSN